MLLKKKKKKKNMLKASSCYNDSENVQIDQSQSRPIGTVSYI